MRKRSIFQNFILLLFCLGTALCLLSCGEKEPEIPEVDYSVSGTRDNTPRVMIPV